MKATKNSSTGMGTGMTAQTFQPAALAQQAIGLRVKVVKVILQSVGQSADIFLWPPQDGRTNAIVRKLK